MIRFGKVVSDAGIGPYTSRKFFQKTRVQTSEAFAGWKGRNGFRE